MGNEKGQVMGWEGKTEGREKGKTWAESLTAATRGQASSPLRPQQQLHRQRRFSFLRKGIHGIFTSEVVEKKHTVCPTNGSKPSTQRHFLHHITDIHNSRMFAFPRSAPVIALNTASENLHHSNLAVSDEWATLTARAPSTTNCAPPCHPSQLDPIHHGTYCNP